jgi:hypothetical protein
MRVTEWAASGDAGRARLVWIDIDARTEKPDPDAVCAEIERILGDPRFDHRWVRDDLLHPDNAPEVRSLADGQVRKVSAVGATIAGGGREPEGRVRLAFELVEMLASDRWMVPCWHHSRVYTGAFGDEEGCTRRGTACWPGSTSAG